MANNVVVVESPAKAKTIGKYLGNDYEILASYGHVRDLVPKEGAVDPEHGYAMKYEVIDKNAKHVDAIARAVKKADTIPLLSDLFGNQSVPFFEVGYLLMYLTFIQIIILAIVLIVLPLIKIGFKGSNKLRTLFYFSGLGIGYMLIEIILIQRFTLYFGNVIYAAAPVVCLMLGSSGFGSLVSQKIISKPYRIFLIVSFIIISFIIYALFLSDWLRTTIGFSLTVKIILSFIWIAPPAFFMGMPFPLGLKLLSFSNDSQIPWAWGINGVFSVVSAVLATIIAVELGFVWVMVFAIGAYLIVLISNLKRT